DDRSVSESIYQVIDGDFVRLVTVAGWIGLVEGMLPAVTQVCVEIGHQHHPPIVVEDGINRRWIVRVIQAEAAIEVPGNSATWHLYHLFHIEEDVKELVTGIKPDQFTLGEQLHHL